MAPSLIMRITRNLTSSRAVLFTCRLMLHLGLFVIVDVIWCVESYFSDNNFTAILIYWYILHTRINNEER